MTISISEMLEAGVHFGHQTRYWNPKMSDFIFGQRNRVHIINLDKTLASIKEAQKFARQVAKQGGTILMVATKRQSREFIVEQAERAKMPFVSQRWLGGTLTNFKTIKEAIKRLKEMQVKQENELDFMPKKEQLLFLRKLEKLEKNIGGVAEMKKLPDAIFVIDVGYHKIAITEAQKLGIPLIGVVDTNHSPEGIDYVIPGNDDSPKATELYAKAIADAILEGREASLSEIIEKPSVSDDEFVEVTEEELEESQEPSEDSVIESESSSVSENEEENKN